MAQSLYWTDILEITLQLIEKYPEVEPINIRFTDLYTWICQLKDFVDDPKRCNEKILEAIQMTWIQEKE